MLILQRLLAFGFFVEILCPVFIFVYGLWSFIGIWRHLLNCPYNSNETEKNGFKTVLKLFCFSFISTVRTVSKARWLDLLSRTVVTARCVVSWLAPATLKSLLIAAAFSWTTRRRPAASTSNSYRSCVELRSASSLADALDGYCFRPAGARRRNSGARLTSDSETSELGLKSIYWWTFLRTLTAD